jgi:hypothetical protein
MKRGRESLRQTVLATPDPFSSAKHSFGGAPLLDRQLPNG